MEHTGCVFAAGIHLSRTYMFRSFESVPWNACVHRLDLSLYSHLKEFWENGARNHVNSKGKVPSNIGSEEVQTRNTVKHKPNTLPAKLFQPLAFDWPCGLQPRSKVKNYAPPPPPSPPAPPPSPKQDCSVSKHGRYQRLFISSFQYFLSYIFITHAGSEIGERRGSGKGEGRGGGECTKVLFLKFPNFFCNKFLSQMKTTRQTCIIIQVCAFLKWIIKTM